MSLVSVPYVTFCVCLLENLCQVNGTKHVWLKIELGFYGIIIKSCVVYIFKFVSFNFVVVVVVFFVLIVFFVFVFPPVNQ